METINDRISAVVKKSGLTKTAFAKKINLSQSFVSNICAGVSSPSDRTIADICKVFNVNESWLRTGNGEMFVSVSGKEAEIFAALSSSMGNKDSQYCRRLAAALARLDETGWELIEQLILKMTGENMDVDSAVASMPDDLSTEAAEALYRSSSGFVPSADLSASNTTDGTAPADGTKGA